MPPKPDSSSAPLRVAVLGGGIAGLAAANRLVELGAAARRPLEVHLFEAAPRLGGSIATEDAGGFLIEGGPDSFLTEKPFAKRLVERIGLLDEVVGTRERFRRTYVVRGGRLCELPEGFLLMAPTRLLPLVASPLFSWPGKLRMALDLVLPARPEVDDESLASFVTRRLGPEALARVAQPLIGGIYTGDPARLSLQAVMPRFGEMERAHRSIILAMRRARVAQGAGGGESSGARWSLFASFRRGMSTLVEALARRLPAEGIHVGSPVSALARTPEGRWSIGEGPGFDAAILAVPARAAARMLEPLDGALAAELEGIPYASSATVTLAYRREDIPHPLGFFGFVVPHVENREILACTFSNLKYPGRAPAEHILLRAFVGGMLQPQKLARDDAEMVAAVRRDLRELIGVVAEPLLRRVHRHVEAMPQYHVGHLQRIDRIAARVRELRGIHLAGAAYRGVGIPDCIHSGETAAEEALAGLAPAQS